MFRDIVFVCAAVNFAAGVARVNTPGNSVYLYEWNQTLAAPRTAAPGLYGVGVYHGSDLYYIYEQLDIYTRPTRRRLLSTCTPPTTSSPSVLPSHGPHSLRSSNPAYQVGCRLSLTMRISEYMSSEARRQVLLVVGEILLRGRACCRSGFRKDVLSGTSQMLLHSNSISTCTCAHGMAMRASGRDCIR